MNCLLAVTCCLLVATISTSSVVAGTHGAHGYAPSSQFFSQDKHGQYSYGYSAGLSSKQESKTHDGVTRGGYSYIDAHGQPQSVQYVADPVHGFRASGTNLPIGPSAHGGVVASPAVGYQTHLAETPEVAHARAEHLAAHAKASAAAYSAPQGDGYGAQQAGRYVAPYVAPYAGLSSHVKVNDAEEAAKAAHHAQIHASAKAAHFAAHAKASAAAYASPDPHTESYSAPQPAPYVPQVASYGPVKINPAEEAAKAAEHLHIHAVAKAAHLAAHAHAKAHSGPVPEVHPYPHY